MLKKITLLFLLLLSACANKEMSQEEKNQQRYLELVNSLQNQENFIESSTYYNIEGEMASLEDGTYRFYVVIDDARSALYNVEALAIVDGKDYSSEMAASVGIFEDKEYTMIPHQANVDDGYVLGLVLSGIAEEKEVDLKVMVQWSNKDESNTKREFLTLHVTLGDNNE